MLQYPTLDFLLLLNTTTTVARSAGACGTSKQARLLYEQNTIVKNLEEIVRKQPTAKAAPESGCLQARFSETADFS